ncbi:hypothetical protein GJAV_G00019340 [Gymnothorax javanicus]|nr:hypothetical protein GJAV_G00019340 [Gymnothorax javanicus]
MEHQEGSEDGSKASRSDSDEEKSLCHTCDVCGKGFPFQSSLSQHMRKHTGARPYKCPYCDHRASQKGNLKAHIRSHKVATLSHGHTKEEAGHLGLGEDLLDGSTSPTESASACNGVADVAREGQPQTLMNSTKRDELADESGTLLFQCSLCRRIMGSQAELEQHTQACCRPYCCRLCSYEAQREDDLLRHVEKVHVTVEDGTRPLEGRDGDREGEEEGVGDGDFPCDVCGQVFSQSWFLKAHMKKHLSTFDYGCPLCGRRFREAWFLKSHMKTHGSRATGRNLRQKTDPEYATTINNVVQDELSGVGVTCLYQLCSKCGNIFQDRENLRAHERVHIQSNKQQGRGEHGNDDLVSPAAKRRLLEYLGLLPVGLKHPSTQSMLGRRIPELDPVCSYQAWQLATKGRVVEAAENGHCLGWDEALADADVAYDRDKGEYVILGQEKRKRDSEPCAVGGKRKSSASHGSQTSCSSGSVNHRSSDRHSHASSGDVSADSLSDSEYRPPSRQGRRASRSKSTECFECGKTFRSHQQMVLHLRVHRREGRAGGEGGTAGTPRWGSVSEVESGSTSPSSPPSSALGEDATGERCQLPTTDEKPYTCNLCDFATSDSALFVSHVQDHQINMKSGAAPAINTHITHLAGNESERGSHSSDSKLRKTLLKVPIPPSTLFSCPEGIQPTNQNPTGSKTPETSSLDGSRLAPLNLSNQSDGWTGANLSLLKDGLGHRPYWGAKIALPSQQPLQLGPAPQPLAQPDGKSPVQLAVASPALPRPGPRPSNSPGTTKGSKPAKRKGEETQHGRPRVEIYPKVPSAKAFEKSAGTSPRLTPGLKTGGQLSDRYLLPQEGLGFMLSSKHGLADHSRPQVSPQTQLSTHLSQSGTKTPPAGRQPTADSRTAESIGGSGHGSSQSLWSAVPGSQSLLANVKQMPMGETPDSTADILSFLKNCNSHDLATLYHRWGSTNPLLDHTGALRSLVRQGDYICRECGKSFNQPSHLRTHMRSHTVLFESNGLRGTDVHPTPTEVPKQVRDHSDASSAHTALLRKGT